MITIPAKMTVVDLTTGKETPGAADWRLLPPAPHLCQVCAFGHDPEAPHNLQTMYYRTAFEARTGRAPTWADAMAHVGDDLAKRWKTCLIESRHWTEPPAGVAPIMHLGPKEQQP